MLFPSLQVRASLKPAPVFLTGRLTATAPVHPATQTDTKTEAGGFNAPLVSPAQTTL